MSVAINWFIYGCGLVSWAVLLGLAINRILAMLLVSKVEALLVVLRPADLEALAPIERRRFANLCRHVADLADQELDRGERPGGVLARLRDGERAS